MTDPKLYPAKVFWSDEDECFVAVAPDLPGTSAFGDTEKAAIDELRIVIPLAIEALKRAGNLVPKPSTPSTLDNFSGKLLLRLPKSLHKRLAKDAEADGVSLNQYIIYRLSSDSENQIKISSVGPQINEIPRGLFEKISASSENFIRTLTKH